MSVGLLATLALGLGDTALAQDSRITGANDSKPCAWPPVHFMAVRPLADPNGEGACTATLIHPRVILFAAHCGKPIRLLFKNTAISKEGRVVLEEGIEKSFVNKNFKVASDVHVDWGVAVLKEPITDTPIIPMATGCELAKLQKSGSPVIMAGGSPNNSNTAEAYVMRWAKTKIARASGSVIHIGAGDPTACKGDSGGPLLAQLPDNSWRTVGITATLMGSCGSPGASNNYAQINERMIKWVIEKTGINVSPCHTPEGKPTPSKACDAFMAYAGDPNDPLGKYDNFCADAKVEPVRNACGIPKSEDAGGEETGGEEGSTSEGAETAGEDTSTSEGDDTGDTGESGDESGKDDTSKEDSTEPTPDESETPDPDEKKPSKDDPSEENGSDKKDEEESEDPKQSSGQKSTSGSGCSSVAGQSGFGYLGALGVLLLGGWRRRVR